MMDCIIGHIPAPDHQYKVPTQAELDAIYDKLELWTDCRVMEKWLRTKANKKKTMTSRFVCTWKFAPGDRG